MKTILDYLISVSFLTSVIVPLITGSLAAAVISYVQSDNFRRKRLVASAYRVALDRAEAVYWIRRRTKNKELLPQDEIIIRDKLHQVQERTEYYKGLLSIEAKWLGESYATFVDAVTKQTGPLLKAAWQEKPVGPGGELTNIIHPKANPDLLKAEQEFLESARQFFTLRYRLQRKFIQR